jgi:glycosyltransferase involved in cell wall biosynthesis
VNDRRVKVLFVPQWYPPPGKAYEVSGTFCREHVQAAALYDDVAVLVFRNGFRSGLSLRLNKIDDVGVPTWYAEYDLLPVPPRGRLTFRLHLPRAIRAVVQTWGVPEVIHTQDGYAYPVMKSSQWLNVPYVISQHWSLFLRRAVPQDQIRRFRWAFGQAQRVLATNYQAGRDYEAYDIRASVRWLPNALDVNVFRPEPVVGRGSWLLHASGLSTEKRVSDIIQAFALVVRERPQAQLHIAGNGTTRPEMQAFAEALLPPGTYCFHGFLPKIELARLMRQCCGFVFPSEFETFGCALMEAMACGCPVLTTQVGGIPAVVPPSDGLFVKVSDIEAIRGGMLRLLDGSHGIDLDRVSQEARQRFSHRAVGQILHEEHVAAVEAVRHKP